MQRFFMGCGYMTAESYVVGYCWDRDHSGGGDSFRASSGRTTSLSV